MKKIFFAAVAALTLSLAACQKEENLVVVNDGDNNTTSEARIKTTSDLHGTDWSYTTTYSEFIVNLTGMDLSCVSDFEDDTLVFGLNFDGTYAHFTFPSNVEALAVDDNGMQQITGVDYEYSYDGTTHTGYLIGYADASDSTVVASQLQFTYNDSTDIITFDLPMFYADDSTAITLTVNFAREN
jgi:hypothetical protein